MKNAYKLLAIIALVAVIEFSMATCGGSADDNGNGGGFDTPTVTNVTVTTASNTTSVAKEGTLQFYATVTGTNSPAQTVTWSIVENDKHAQTTISNNGLLTVSAAETLTSLTIKAVSTVDAAKNGTKVVTISGSSSSVQTFTSIVAFETWITAQSSYNFTPYTVKINLSSLGGNSDIVGSVGKLLKDNSSKYVSLDFSDSTFTSIGDQAFKGCTGIKSITMPNNVTSIGNEAFSACSSLTSVSIPNSVISIGERAFSGCISLTSISIGNNVTSIGERAFQLCWGLTVITVDGANTAYTSENGILYNKNKTTLIKYPEKKTADSFTMPNSVNNIEGYAFNGCTNLTSVIIGTSVTSIGIHAFSECSSLTSVTFQSSIPSNQFNTAAFGISGSISYIGDLRDKYLTGGLGRYTRPSDSSTWTRQQ